MFTAQDAEALAAEKAHLAELAGKPFLERCKGYYAKTGPGWLQSALTLGAGSASSSLIIGAFYQYDLLWLQPMAMLLGIIMMMALSYQTLSTQARPFDAMRRYAHPAIAWSWAIATLVATVIWHLPQYALAGGMSADIITATTGWDPSGGARTALLIAIGLIILTISTIITWNYSAGWKGVRIYERALKLMVWVIIVSFTIVIIRSAMLGKVEWGKVLKGFLPLKIPTDAKGIETVMGAFGAAIGINMTFLFPYTLLARGWGREHRGLSRFDLMTGMLLPFSMATSLMIIAAGCTLYGNVEGKLSTIQAAQMMAQAGVGVFFGRIIFGLGLIGMALSSITLHMLVSGFAFCEMFGIEPKGWKYKLACMIPAPAFLGVVLWKYMGFWIGVRTSAVCGILLPIAYIGFFILNNRKDYLGEDTPKGGLRLVWNIGMLAAIGATVAFVIHFLANNYDKILALK